MKIQFLWWAECPSHPVAWQRLQQVLDDLQVTSPVERLEIRTDQDAAEWQFPGSPTIRINGVDIDPGAPTAHRLTCRLYFTEDGRASPVPSIAMIKRAVERALQDEQST